MAITGMTKLIERHLELSHEQSRTFLDDHHFGDGIEAARHVGNIYSGSAYLSLMFLLWNRFQAEGDEIIGKRILLGSYGSGNTMSVISMEIAPHAPQVIAKWDLKNLLDESRTADFSSYDRFIAAETVSLETGEVTDGNEVPSGRYYLAGVRDDGYRTYLQRE